MLLQADFADSRVVDGKVSGWENSHLAAPLERQGSLVLLLLAVIVILLCGEREGDGLMEVL